jgi:DhnA family fructose-bisphosphate aldolase class Ia
MPRHLPSRCSAGDDRHASTDPLDEFGRVVEAAGDRPLLAGGVSAPDDELIVRSAELLPSGAGGLAYGRNIWRATDPSEMIRNLLYIIHSTGRSAVHDGQPTDVS